MVKTKGIWIPYKGAWVNLWNWHEKSEKWDGPLMLADYIATDEQGQVLCRNLEESEWPDLSNMTVMGDVDLTEVKRPDFCKLPRYIYGSLIANFCGIKSLDGFPDFVQNECECMGNALDGYISMDKTRLGAGCIFTTSYVRQKENEIADLLVAESLKKQIDVEKMQRLRHEKNGYDIFGRHIKRIEKRLAERRAFSEKAPEIKDQVSPCGLKAKPVQNNKPGAQIWAKRRLAFQISEESLKKALNRHQRKLKKKNKKSKGQEDYMTAPVREQAGRLPPLVIQKAAEENRYMCTLQTRGVYRQASLYYAMRRGHFGGR